MAKFADRHKTIAGLVERYSPSGEEQEVVGWLVNRMEELGFDEAFIDGGGNAVGVKGDGDSQVLLLGHIDTVPGEIPVRIVAGSLFGRGTVDAKGPLACFVDAIAAVDPDSGWQFVVVGAVDEERDSTGARFLADQYRPAFLIVGEPSGWNRITLGYKGVLTAHIHVRKSSAHGASKGANACERAVNVWNDIARYSDKFNKGKPRLFAQILPSLRGMRSGENGFEEWAELNVTTRLPSEVPPNNWEWVLKEICSAFDADYEITGFPVPAYRSEKNTPLVRLFLRSIREAGGTPGFTLKTGTSDLNIVAPIWNCPAVVYGPGDSRLDHTPNENIDLSEFDKAVEVLEGVLKGMR